MKKLLALISSLLFVAAFATPAQSAGANYSVYQKTLAAFSSNATGLTSQQKAQVKAAVETNPTAEKFICTGIRYYNQPMSVNITVRKRAKAACDYAKLLNPGLSTWYQNKPTQARSYSGKVLLTVKSPELSLVTNEASLAADICKIAENSRVNTPGDPVQNFAGQREIQGRYSGNATAFPFRPTTLPITGDVNVRLVYVDWADLPGTKVDYDYYKSQVKMFEDFYWMASEHKLKMSVTLSDNWHRITGSYEDFTLSFEEEAQRGEAPKKQVFYDAAISASDSSTDYSDTDIVFFAIPRSKSVFFGGGPHEFNFDYNGYLKTEEGNIYNTATAGDFLLTNDGQPPWVYYVHETGHMLGIPHQANEDLNKPFTEMYEVLPLGGWDIMSNQGGATRTITAWLRWLAGWLDDSQVICQTKESLSNDLFSLSPINQVSGNVETLIIKMSESKVLVLESRRHDSYFDIETGVNKDGVLAYTVDATLASAQGNQQLLSPRDITKYLEQKNSWPDWRELDVVLYQGDKLVFEGLEITNVRSASDADLIQVRNLDK